MLVRLMREHLRPYRWAVVALLVFQLAQTLATLYLPSLNARIIDDGVTVGNTTLIWHTGWVMLAVSLGQVVAAVIATYVGARTAMRLGRDLRRRLFAHVQGLSPREVSAFGAPTLITRNTNDVQQVTMVVYMTMVFAVMAPIMLIGGVVMAMREDVPLSAVLLVVIPVLGVAIGLVVRRMVPYFQQMQKRIDAVNAVLREQIGGMRVIRAFVREDRESRRFGAANDDLYAASLATGRLMALMFPMVMLIMNVSTLAIMWFGGHRIESGGMAVGQLTAFITYVMYILMAVMMSSMLFVMIPRAMVAAGRIGEVLDTSTTVVAPEQPVPPVEEHRGRVELVGVTFCYPGAEHPVLQDVTFTACPGQTTAVVGATGSGKTTLLNLVPRLYDATGGQVLVAGVDVRDLDPTVLWSQIGLVPQRPYLFSGTVRSNLQHGKEDATDDELWHALEVAQARDFVASLDEGLDAPVAQGGTNVSGGQRQRLAIARALVRRPSIYLFDDSFSALDYATDAALRTALIPETRDATVIIVAQRVATIRHADRIVVLDGGRVVAEGTHTELLATSQTYQEIVYSQLSATEAVGGAE
ncbi:MAG: ABC transporter ATP-binding protein/permease [Micrococcales bacterium]|nr:ABC transporter ATP-binding protein/permease [Micrococcales bacterium]